MKRRTEKQLLSLIFCICLMLLAPAGTAGVLRSEAAAVQLKTPEPVLNGAFSVTWKRVEHAGGYEVKAVLDSGDGEQAVTRTFSTTSNTVDMTLFAAGCEVSVSVRAVPSSQSKNKYKNSSWGECYDVIEPSEDNETVGYAGVSGKRFYLADASGNRYSGWQRVNGFWFYFDPANGKLTASGWASVGGVYYYFTDAGKMHTGWLDSDHYWYYLNPTDGRMVTGWFQVSPNKPYYFTENAASGQPVGSLNEAQTRAQYPDSNPPYPQNRGTGTANPGQGAGTPSQPAAVSAWKANPDGSWSYTKNGTAVKNSWEKVDGFWYYFNGKGIMLTGWQFLNSRWYYLEPDPNGSRGYKYGAMWCNATTPDGYTVNGDGMWVQNGQVVTTAGNGNSGAGNTGNGGSRVITSCKISVSAADAGAGACRKAVVTGATNCRVGEQSYSVPYESWKPGSSITITVTLTANDGYTFGSTTSYSCTGAKLTGQSGTASTRTVRLTYTPVMKLAAPDLVFINENGELMWMPVANAKRYTLRITGEDGKTVTKTVSAPGVDLWEYGDLGREAMKLTVSALGPDGNSSYIESDRRTISDVAAYMDSHMLGGSIVIRDGKPRYLDEYGEKVTGWQNLLGRWYHFKKNGSADGPGWFQDESGYWYYFDAGYAMMTGTVNDGGKTYYLNDGSRSDLPTGAWVEGR